MRHRKNLSPPPPPARKEEPRTPRLQASRLTDGVERGAHVNQDGLRGRVGALLEGTARRSGRASRAESFERSPCWRMTSSMPTPKRNLKAGACLEPPRLLNAQWPRQPPPPDAHGLFRERPSSFQDHARPPGREFTIGPTCDPDAEVDLLALQNGNKGSLVVLIQLSRSRYSHEGCQFMVTPGLNARGCEDCACELWCASSCHSPFRS